MDSSKKRKFGILITAAVGLLACGARMYYEYRAPPAVVYHNDDSSSPASLIGESTYVKETTVPLSTAETPDSGATAIPEETRPEPIPIYLCGSVETPGVYYVEVNTFLFELIDRAGGLQQDAAADHINLVMKLTAPVSIFIPSTEDMKDGKQTASPGQIPGFVRAGENDYVWGETEAEERSSSPEGTESLKININTADETELMKLSGIGEVTASAIIRYRTDNGAFVKIEDIMKVPGIKQGRFDAIKDMIEV